MKASLNDDGACISEAVGRGKVKAARKHKAIMMGVLISSMA